MTTKKKKKGKVLPKAVKAWAFIDNGNIRIDQISKFKRGVFYWAGARPVVRVEVRIVPLRKGAR